MFFLLNSSYLIAVFTDPGSPATTRDPYASLPTEENMGLASLTVKSTGEMRFCKKCNCRKPDRAHHCSSCKRCVLKMDHHCPWLATCVGLRNHKPFLLFLIYVSLFCWLCFAASGSWFWYAIADTAQFEKNIMPVNYVLLAVLSGIMGIVLTGFTAWHIYIACVGQTTIESLEKTRYLTNLRKNLQSQFNNAQENYAISHPNQAAEEEDTLGRIGHSLLETHANAIPGVTRPEEGETFTPPRPGAEPRPSSASPAQASLQHNAEMERRREQARYNAYLEEQDSERLPHAFNLGWRRNLRNIFGPSPWLWWLPVRNSIGDGWNWEPSAAWVAANEDLAREREARVREEAAFASERGWSAGQPIVDFRSGRGLNGPPPRFGSGPPRPARQMVADDAEYDSSESESDDQDESKRRLVKSSNVPILDSGDGEPGPALRTENWNDIPQGFLDNRRNVTGTRSPRGKPTRYR